jgi:DNA repair protein RadA/Sms
MVRKKTTYCCQECGYETPQWLGKCSQCGLWNTFQEVTRETSRSQGKTYVLGVQEKTALKPLVDVDNSSQKRMFLGVQELDRVLGGGIFPHTTVLLAGEPGIGKSTLLLQAAARTAHTGKKPVLFISAEESLMQVRERFARLGLEGDSLYVISETDVEVVKSYIQEVKPSLVIVDSVQALYGSHIPSPPGTLIQVREVSLELCRLAKEQGFVLFLVGHVTKDGVLAGPKSLEHLVDTVLYFEGDRYQSLRLVRTVKNRFGSTGELGIFEMTAQGLTEIANPSEIFLPEGGKTSPGRVTAAIMEGRRPFLVEIQALTNKTSFQMPLRRAVGIELNKISLIIAVIERALSMKLSGVDIFLKVVGGLRLSESAADLAITTAIISSFKECSVPYDVVFVGEVGLSGEIRKVQCIEARIKEAARLGFKKIIVPKNNIKDKPLGSLVIKEIENLAELYALFFIKHTVRTSQGENFCVREEQGRNE